MTSNELQVSTWTNDALMAGIRAGHNEVGREIGNVMEGQRRAVEAAWRTGRQLTELKSRLSHGQWLPCLAQMDVPTSTAAKYMRVARLEIYTHVNLPDTIELAAKLSDQESADGKPVAKKKADAKLTAKDKALIRANDLENETSRLADELKNAQFENETLRQTNGALETEVFNNTGTKTRVASEIEQVRERERQTMIQLTSANGTIVELNRTIKQQRAYIKKLAQYIEENGLEVPR